MRPWSVKRRFWSPSEGQATRRRRFPAVKKEMRTDLKQNRKLLILSGGIRRLRGKISLRRSSGRQSPSRQARWAERRATHTIVLMVRPSRNRPHLRASRKRPAPVLRCGWTTRWSRGVSSEDLSDRSATSFTLNDPLRCGARARSLRGRRKPVLDVDAKCCAHTICRGHSGPKSFCRADS